MPLIIPSDNRKQRWDRTPKSHIRTRRYEVRSAPDLARPRAIQRQAYDWALKTLDANPNLKVRARGDSLWARLTRARHNGTLPREPVVLQRAATNQAHAVFEMLEKHREEKAQKTLTEQDEKTTPRTLRRLATPPRHITEYFRSYPSKQHRRQAIAVLEGVTTNEDGTTVKVPGIGQVTLNDPVHEPIRSAQLVERNGKLWLHAQHGEKLPEPKSREGHTIGYDSGITNTLTSSTGEKLHRPDTSELEHRARKLYRHRKRHCTYKSRQWRKLGKQASRLRAKSANKQLNWERHTAQDISTANNVVGLENLELKSMTASAKGTVSMPGSRRKRGLNEKLARSRLARLHHAIARRGVKDGTWIVAVNPKNTSIQCHQCKAKDKESRKGEEFKCTQCGFEIHADENAGRNIQTRAMNVLAGYAKTRGAGDRCPGSEAPYRQGLRQGPGEAGYATLHPREAGPARRVDGPGARPG